MSKSQFDINQATLRLSDILAEMEEIPAGNLRYSRYDTPEFHTLSKEYKKIRLKILRQVKLERFHNRNYKLSFNNRTVLVSKFSDYHFTIKENGVELFEAFRAGDIHDVRFAFATNEF